ncbi:MAG TPA: DUF2550 domain-containing protein [Jatrophihabitans sp.]|nr:DUF2550 domain-containing protein [Jatrophihabitans sp.]
MAALVENVSLFTVCLVLVLAVVAWMLALLRQRHVVASAGGLPVALKRGPDRWANGVGRYVGDELVWYRTLSLSPAAAMRLSRDELSVVATRAWDPAQDMALRPNLAIVECRVHGKEVSLGFPDNGVTGFLSWLEASAPKF